MKEALLKRLRETLPEFITRKVAEELTMGLVKARTLANLDSKGLGPKERTSFKRRVVYSKESFLLWFSLYLEDVDA